ncbi:MAG TPA: gas vesicle protein [Actinomycetales bacterium]|nr:gas vesicle protein [Actinomycetales bacterium]
MTQQPQGPVYVGSRQPQSQSQNLADVLERVLDKGIVIVGDIQVRLLDIELLTIKLRLMVASVERAKEMGINWWEGDPFVSTLAEEDRRALLNGGESAGRQDELERRLDILEQQVGRQEGEHEPGR